MRYLALLTLFLFSFSCKDDSNKSAKNNSDKEESRVTQDPLAQSMDRGALVYEDFCMQCHLADGTGVSGTFPPLAKSNWLTDRRKESIHAVKFGQSGEIVVNNEVYNSLMPPMGLTDEEIADVMNYILNSWGNSDQKMVSVEEVAAIEK